jgi:hypothetical protein
MYTVIITGKMENKIARIMHQKGNNKNIING